MKRMRELKLIVALVSVYALAVLFAYLYKASMDQKPPAATFAEISEMTRLNFSENVKIIGVVYHSFLDAYLHVALEVPADEIEALFPEEKFHPSTTTRYVTIQDYRWFRPDSVKKFKSFSYYYSEKADKMGMNVLYDDSDAAIRKVYIEWFWL